MRYKCIRYNLKVMRQSACFFFNTIMVDNHAAFFNCTPVGRASDSNVSPDLKLFILDSWGRSFWSVAWPAGVQLVFFFSFAHVFSTLFGALGSPSSDRLTLSVSPRFDSSWWLS